MLAPEHARWTKVTELFGSARSSARAAFAVPDFAERWHLRSSHTGPLLGKPKISNSCALSGLPSPEAFESPIDTISRSLTVIVFVIEFVSPSCALTVNVTAYWPSAGKTERGFGMTHSAVETVANPAR